MNFVRAFKDPFLFLPVIGLSGISLFTLASQEPRVFVSQLSFMMLGFFLYFIFSSIDYHYWPKFRYIFYVLSLLLLSLLFFLPEVRGAQRWINLGAAVIQPSEILKPLVILIYAYFFSRQRSTNTRILEIVSFLPLIVLIFIQPDLGNTIVYLTFYLGLLIVSGLSWLYLSAGALFLIALIPALWFFLRDYQKLRISTFINPALDPKGAGYNAIQSIIAIGSGGLTGLGLGRGSQSRLYFLPEYQTDFIFASIIEALGFLGGAIIIFLYFVLLFRILSIALNTDNIYGRFLSIGIFSQIFIQVFINIGMNMGIMPITGITLPLLSSGGSSIISTFIALGIVNSVGREINKSPLVIS